MTCHGNPSPNNEGFAAVCFMCLGFLCPICDYFRYDNEVTFLKVNYVLFCVFCLDRPSWSGLQVCLCGKDGNVARVL
jgi:hypothetical protein